ncbi:MAG: Na+/H+ antiporter subunit C [Anaerolineae bacterium]|nr:Na+/H+ antiporter subunit C [Anaerolineae bacterium]
MEVVLPFVIGVLYAAGLYMLLRRGSVKLLLGLMLLGYATNLLIFATGGLVRSTPVIIPPGAQTVPAAAPDPVPQALVLTAIVIGFGIQAFALVLFKQLYQAVGSVDLDKLEVPAEQPTEKDAVA